MDETIKGLDCLLEAMLEDMELMSLILGVEIKEGGSKLNEA